MRARVLVGIASALALFAGACGEDQPALQPPPSSPTPAGELAEVTLDDCVIDQGETAPSEPTGEPFETIADGVLTVGSDTAFPPFEFIEDGEAKGFDIDLITELAKRLELEVEVKSAAFDTIFQALASGRFDVVVSAVTIKEDRKQSVDFTTSYFDADQSLAVAANSDIAGVEDLAGKTVGVQAGTTGEDCAKNALQAKDKVAEVTSYDTAPDAFSDLTTGRIDAVILDLPTANQIVAERGGAEVVQAIRTQEQYGIAVRKSQPDLRVAIDEQLAAMRQDGTYRDLFMKWFDAEPPA